MRTLLKVFGVLVAVLVLLAIVGFVYVQLTWDRDYSSVALPAITASSDPVVIANGEYVAKALAHCTACHTLAMQPDGSYLANPHGVPSGGFIWDIPVFGRFVAANITPDPSTGIGAMSDGAIARAVRTSVDRNGKIMPFMSLSVGMMSDEDLTALISWLRTQPSVVNETAPGKWGFIAKMISGNLKPRLQSAPTHVPEGFVSVERGRYIAEGPASCVGCHTAMDMMTFSMTGAPFSGNPVAEPDPSDPDWEFVIPNLTPDPTTGQITAWDEDRFVQRFREGRVFKGSKMPWENYALMTDADLRSIYQFLRTLPPVQNEIGPTRRQIAGQ